MVEGEMKGYIRFFFLLSPDREEEEKFSLSFSLSPQENITQEALPIRPLPQLPSASASVPRFSLTRVFSSLSVVPLHNNRRYYSRPSCCCCCLLLLRTALVDIFSSDRLLS